MRVLVFGDSIAYGAWDTEGGWAERLKRKAHKQTVQSQGKSKLQIINLGIGGNSSSKIVERMPGEILARFSPSWPLVFIISFGANDERSTNGLPEVPLEKFASNLKQIIEIARKYSEKIMFLGIPPIGKSIVEFKGKEYSDERIKIYDEKMKSIVEEAGLSYLPIRPIFEKKGLDKLYSYDQVHPNDYGHKLIANIVEPELRKILRDTEALL